MFRQVLKLLSVKSVNISPCATYQNFVMNDALAQIEKQCENWCPVPRFPPQKVCVMGAGTDIGRIVSLFLKQQSVIKILSMYDDVPQRYVLGVANDIAHIDTSTAVEAYQGRVYLKAALHDSDVVVICGGCHTMPPCCNITDRDLFFHNKRYVRSTAIACAQFAPHAIIAIQTPPVDANFNLVKHTLIMADGYDPRRVLGVNAINSMRANQLYSSLIGEDPSTMTVPVICGTGRCTRVPVFSVMFLAARACTLPQSQAECLTRLVREADEIICKVKSNYEQGHLSIGFSTARCVTNIMKGLFVKPTYLDSALVEQGSPEKCYQMPICATPVKIGSGGIVEYSVPVLNASEKQLLEDSKPYLEDMLNLGQCFAEGSNYYTTPPPIDCVPPPREPCPLCTDVVKKKKESN